MGCNPPGASVHGIFPDKNTGVGCHFLLQGSSWPRDRTRVSWTPGRLFTIWANRETPKVKVAQSCPTLCEPGQNTGVLFHFSSRYIQPRKWTRVSCIAGRFFTYWAIRKAPRRLEGVPHPFSSGSSRPRNWTGVSCIAGGFITNWAMREALLNQYVLLIPSLLMVGQGSLSSPVRTMAMYCFWIPNRNLPREEKSLLKGQQNVSLSRGEMKLCVYVLLSGVHPYFGINSSPPVLLPPPIELSF